MSKFSILLCIVIMSLTKVQLHAIEIKDNPFIIINLQPSDCMSKTVYIKQVYEKICSERFLILSDDKLMKTYLERNNLLPKGVDFIWDKGLSKQLSTDYRSNLALITKSDTTIYFFEENFETDLNTISKILEPYCKEHKAVLDVSARLIKESSFQDSLTGSNFINLNFDNNKTIIFNERFQIGTVIDENSSRLQYYFPEVSEKTHVKLSNIIDVQDENIRLESFEFTQEILNKNGLPLIKIQNTERNSLLFSLTICHNRGSEEEKETAVRNQMMLAWQTENDDYSLDINDYDFFTMIDSIQYHNKEYIPLNNRSYITSEKTVFIPYFNVNYSGKDHDPSQLVIFELNLQDNQKVSVKNMYPSSILIDTIPDVLLKLDDEHFPVILNKITESIHFINPSKSHTLSFSEIFPMEDKMYYLYDFEIAENNLRYLGILKSNQVVFGNFNLETHEFSYTPLSTERFTNATLNEDKIQAIIKNEEIDELVLFEFEVDK